MNGKEKEFKPFNLEHIHFLGLAQKIYIFKLGPILSPNNYEKISTIYYIFFFNKDHSNGHVFLYEYENLMKLWQINLKLWNKLWFNFNGSRYDSNTKHLIAINVISKQATNSKISSISTLRSSLFFFFCFLLVYFV